MAKGKWKESADLAAAEAYLVLIKGEKPTKRYPKDRLQGFLKNESIRLEFLKLCFEHDDSKKLGDVRRGIFLCAQAWGASAFADAAKVNRISLYRMLGKGGNPSLQYILSLLKVLGMRLWAVEDAFTHRREKLRRPKDIEKDFAGFEAWIARQAREQGTLEESET